MAPAMNHPSPALFFDMINGLWRDDAAQEFTTLRTAENIAARKGAGHQTRCEAFLPLTGESLHPPARR